LCSIFTSEQEEDDTHHANNAHMSALKHISSFICSLVVQVSTLLQTTAQTTAQTKCMQQLHVADFTPVIIAGHAIGA
jgi:hypothetical protein